MATENQSSGKRVAVVGSGLIGRAWAIAFARAGCAVKLWDPDANAPDRAVAFAREVVPGLEAAGLIADGAGAALIGRLHPATTLDEALDGVDWVQESGPETIETKIAAFAELDALAPPAAILASSTSALLPSAFTEGLANRHRCLVAHPINPPYLVPAVEVVPAPWTSGDSVETARRFLAAIGQTPLVMTRELDGFIMNRLQGALLEEAFRLVAGGYASAEDVDRGLSDGLALRWSFMGPFETIDLNAPGGVADYVARYQPLYENLFPSMQERVDWSGAVLGDVLKTRREALPETGLAERQSWRDRRLMALIAHKRTADDRFGR